MKRKPLAKPRSLAFLNQSGFCYYCNQPMWLKNQNQFSLKHKITLSQSKSFQCTGEHLTPHHNGGSTSKHNIVAACWHCNQKRHRRKSEINSEQYKHFVNNRMSKGRWHNIRLSF